MGSLQRTGRALCAFVTAGSAPPHSEEAPTPPTFRGIFAGAVRRIVPGAGAAAAVENPGWRLFFCDMQFRPTPRARKGLRRPKTVGDVPGRHEKHN